MSVMPNEQKIQEAATELLNRGPAYMMRWAYAVLLNSTPAPQDVARYKAIMRAIQRSQNGTEYEHC